jgi:hypothetical protein
MRRSSLLLIAGWYLLASNNLVYVGLDWLAPQTKTIASADFPCAHHDCGCKTAEQCRLHCCCHPQVRQPSASGAMCHLAQESPKTVRVSYLSEAQCRGHHDPAQPSLHKLDPHLPLTAAPLLARAVAHSLSVCRTTVRLGIFADPPDKIPI